MTGTSSTSRRFAWRKSSQTKKQPHGVCLRVERLEDRAVPSYFPTTTNGIHIIEDQLPGGLSDAVVRFLATHTDGTQKETLSTTEQFRAINPDFTVLHYQLGTGNSSYDYIINNQWSSDFNYVNQQESWFAHQSYSGEPQSAADLASGRVGNSSGWYQADIANPAWQQYTLSQVFQNMAATGSNAWFADSYTYGLGGAGYSAPVPTRYQGTNAANPAYWPGGVTWTDQLGNWARTVENAFTQYNATYGTDYKFIPNLDARVTSWEPDWYNDSSGVPVVDGAFLEGFGQYTDTYNWTLSMNRGLNLTRNDKIVIMQSYPADPNTAAGQQQIDFLLGTYLLLKGDQTYLNLLFGGGAQYYPEYQLDLGAPTTPLASDVSGYLWNGVYRRDFQNGFVLVNPGGTAHTLNLGGIYRQVRASGGGVLTGAQIDASGNYTGGSLTYQDVSSITLAGGSAAIFLNELQDPGFEEPSVGAGSFQYQPGGSPWTFGPCTGVAANGSAFTAGNPDAPDGDQVAFLQGPATFSQAVFFAAGTYSISFQAAQRQNVQFSSQTIQVQVDGNVVGTFTPPDTNYSAYNTASFPVTAGAHTIAFVGTDPDGQDNTAFIDQVRVNRVLPVLQDPGFETPNVGTGTFNSFQYHPSNSPWTFSTYAGVAGNGGGFTDGNPDAPQGTQVAFLQGPSSASQAVTLAAGTYSLSFSAAQRGDGNYSSQTFQVQVDGTVVGTFTPGSTSYTAYTTPSFTVTAGAHSITFVGLDPAGADKDNTAFIDQVLLFG
jgi:hypothetical protein